MFKFFRLILPTLALCVSAPLHGDTVRNGGGVSEQNLAYALLNIERLTSFCLQALQCGLTAYERETLQAIVHSAPQERANLNLIEYNSERESPGFFWLDGAVRRAKTGNNVGDTIYINRELLYTLDQGTWVAMSVAETLGLLIHEMGHHHGVTNHDSLDLMAVKVMTFLQQKIYTAPFDKSLFQNGDADALPSSTRLPSATVIIFKPDSREDPEPSILISDSDNVYDLTNLVREGIIRDTTVYHGTSKRECWNASFGQGHMPDYRLHSFRISSPHWTYVVPHFMPGSTGYTFLFRGLMTVICEKRNGEFLIQNGMRLHLTLAADLTQDKIRLRVFEDLIRPLTVLLVDDPDFKTVEVANSLHR